MRIWGTVVCVMLLTGQASAQRPDPPSVKYTICSAYTASVAALSARAGDLERSATMGKLAERFAAKAIELDEAEGLLAWATRDLINQLSVHFKSQIATETGVQELSSRHQTKCANLANEIGLPIQFSAPKVKQQLELKPPFNGTECAMLMLPGWFPKNTAKPFEPERWKCMPPPEPNYGWKPICLPGQEAQLVERRVHYFEGRQKQWECVTLRR